MEGSWREGEVVLGRVTSFDEGAGLGEIECWGPLHSLPDPASPRSGERVPFHCVSIADGSRSIEVGAEVAFVLRPGRDGREWAAGIVGIVPRAPAG